MDEIVIANTFLRCGKEESIEITPMKMQKLFYLLYRDYLKVTGMPLFPNRFEAWQFGPVLESLYRRYRKYDSNPIQTYEPDLEGNIICYDLTEESAFSDAFRSVWNRYKYYSPVELSNLTHQSGGAWDYTIRNIGGNGLIPDEQILYEVWR